MPQQLTNGLSPKNPLRAIWLFIFIMGLLSITILIANEISLQYHLINYFDLTMVRGLIVLCLICAGLYFFRQPFRRLTLFFNGFTLYYFILALYLFFSMCVALTPFAPIDPWLVKIDNALGYHQVAVLAFVYRHPWLQHILWIAYNSILFQLIIIPAGICCLQNRKRLYELLLMYLTTGIVGDLIYYFWPTMAPASQFHSGYFILQENETWIKFYDLHHYLLPKLTDGGLIAFPSFHVIWSMLLLYALRGYRYIFYPMLIIDIILICACVMLGWHYVTDVIGAFVILIVCALLTQKF